MDEANFEKLKQYFTDHPDLGVASVYLFGSHAEGRAHRESDVDVGILLQWERHPTQDDRSDMRVQLGSELISVLHHNEVDVVILTHRTVEKNVNAALRRIEALPTIPAPVVRVRLEELL